ncbi:unnamed protein product [Gordionus sp. m RMFG-2023]
MTKKKYTDLYAENSHSILLPGRHPCECQASKHKLINNCMKCGRIVCVQEGSGPCHFCDNIVCSNEEQEILNRCSKASDKLLNKLMNQKCELTQTLEKAIENKNRLLNYDKTSAERTLVIDDQSDYFALEHNSWLSPIQRKIKQEREKLLFEAKHKSKSNKTISLLIDFNKNNVFQDDLNEITNMEEMKIEKPKNIIAQPNENFLDIDNNSNIDEKILKNFPLPKFDYSVITQLSSNDKIFSCPNSKFNNNSTRLQDDEFLNSFDQKKCLSMHQPHASLLIFGVKKEEGRNWYTAHRGRLWIASTTKRPETSEIKTIESFYQEYYANILGKPEATKMKYPGSYPTGCLLGCVSIDNCLTQEEFRKRVLLK